MKYILGYMIIGIIAYSITLIHPRYGSMVSNNKSRLNHNSLAIYIFLMVLAWPLYLPKVLFYGWRN